MAAAHRLAHRIWIFTRHRAANHHRLRCIVLNVGMSELCKCFPRAPFGNGREPTTDSEVRWRLRVEIDHWELCGLPRLTIQCLWFGLNYLWLLLLLE
jgi:hypothetical protein